MSRKQRRPLGDESGFVTIIVAMIITVLLGLVTIGFVRLIGREQRQSLDRQLSTQAFYAAETGVNDVVKALTANSYSNEKTDCNPNAPGLNLTPDLGNGISYTCVLISQAPVSLEYSSVATDKTTVVPIKGVDPSDKTTVVPINKLIISWQAESGAASFPNPTAGTFPFPPSGSWSEETGMVRVAMTALRPSLSRNTMLQETLTAFAYPNQQAIPGQAGALNFSAGTGALSNQGQNVYGQCNSGSPGANPQLSRYCNVVIDNFPGGAFNSEYQYLLLLKGMYKPSTVTITAYGNIGGVSTQLRLAGVQAMVDVTGKAQDVLKRIQVRVPKIFPQRIPEYTIEVANDLCKRWEISGNVANPNECGY